MRMCVLDGYTLNPGDLTWGAFEDLGDLTVFERTAPDLAIERSVGAEILITNKTPISRDMIDRLPNLRYIGVLATGYNTVDVSYAKQRGILVSNIPMYGTRSVAQFVFALLLELCHHVKGHSDSARSGKWSRCPDFSFWEHPLIELDGKTMGIIGFGRIGRQTGSIARAFGMRVIAYDNDSQAVTDESEARWASLPDLFAQSDVISLHCPLTPETTGIINASAIQLMKSSSFLINSSRGPLVIEEDLAQALNCHRIAGAAVDVLSEEPPRPDNPLLFARNCIVTPHIAWATKEARQRLMDAAVENVRSFLNGNPINIVNP